MMTILDFMNKSGLKSFKKYDGEIGLEIETETKSAESYPKGLLVPDERGNWKIPSLKYWDTHADGSLRDFGLEFVLKQPVRFKKELPAALNEFDEKLSGVKFIKDSVTTSVHVHLNMLNESFKTLGNFLTLYTLFENLLIRYSGPDRLSNLFCLPICDAEDTYKNIVGMMQQIEKKYYKGLFFNESNVKYAALNLGAFSAYGSMEVRSFRGETDTKAISNWVSILYSLLEYARKDINPKEIMLSWKDKQKKLLDEVFTDYRKELVHPDEFKLVDQNVWYAGSIAYSVKNWASLDETVKPPEFKPKQKELEMMASHYFQAAWIALDNAQQDFIIKKLKADHDKKYYNGEVAKTKPEEWEIQMEAIPDGGRPAPPVPPLVQPAARPQRMNRPVARNEFLELAPGGVVGEAGAAGAMGRGAQGVQAAQWFDQQVQALGGQQAIDAAFEAARLNAINNGRR